GPIDPGLAAGVALGTAVLLIVGLVLLIRWLRRRGNKRPKNTTTLISVWTEIRAEGQHTPLLSCLRDRERGYSPGETAFQRMQ
ncbi:unnamed protein product, partial [Gadus morhua 'NCC']